MSVLPYQELKRLCNTPIVTKKPLVSPAFDKTVYGGKTFGLSEAGYDIRIKEGVTIYPLTLETLVHNWLYANKKHWLLRRFKRFRELTYWPTFVLASTIEHFNIPNDLVVWVADKSSWARRGLAVQNTVVEPGWRGWLTLELTNHGPDKLVIDYGTPIAQMLFLKLTEPTELVYDGKYQDQADRPVEAIEEKDTTDLVVALDPMTTFYDPSADYDDSILLKSDPDIEEKDTTTDFTYDKSMGHPRPPTTPPFRK